MHLLNRVLISAVAATLAVAGSASAIMARGYTPRDMARSYGGSWPVTVSGSQVNFTGCLTLTGSGSASVTIGSQRYSDGSYFVVNNLLVATIPAQGYGQNAGLVFTGRAARNKLGLGVYEDVYGGGDFNSGALSFGTKGGC
jgi:hypothetical protein